MSVPRTRIFSPVNIRATLSHPCLPQPYRAFPSDLSPTKRVFLRPRFLYFRAHSIFALARLERAADQSSDGAGESQPAVDPEQAALSLLRAQLGARPVDS